MEKHTITGDDLLGIGFTEGKVLGKALKLIAKKYKNHLKSEVLGVFSELLANPENYLEDKILGDLAKLIIEERNISNQEMISLNETPPSYTVFGQSEIEHGALDQMDVAMKLPVTVAGALMPDAHQGYGLPIGGVLATRNAIIPYGVGVDIGCRMALSVFDFPADYLEENLSKFKRELIAWTKFGAGNGWETKYRADHVVLENPNFNITSFVKSLHDKAYHQLGSSGGGNHFVEFGILDFHQEDVKLGIPKGKYVALLTHSGSRGFGATIAGHYTKLAKSICRLPSQAANLAYLDMNSAEGQEYWLAMNLAGDYASACHEVIHQRLIKALGATVLAKVENHHNFAWKEMWQGEEVIVHRKGATPAAKDQMGIIPGSMTAPGFLVRGKGEETALHSASHGAGRVMSRTQAIKSITKAEMNAVLKEHQVSLIGAGLDEAPMAYKNIETVMASQENLVDIVAKFSPRLVRMADDGSRED